ncbi:MAG: translesion error-prone DNA polymerase V autoproteolytic subunit [Candidatus Cloacimonetes bacterium]|jgi:DNA polymerase V|nr:translesion error-prone DNA polymerase V autoproteolytic subunit [Candidatus Cloacimonadota bacterium]HOA28849.1 translesion error-prone DNA polymerase V autoproteolytic subunit [Candidatus Cloacimonadota bacterium]HOH60012.1 translesion error-prone DNA polymerase V autoproteolytic subunit [Candidatus Cloacimonadota bacterium]HPI25072.1 translesion error-prone DNA polymerase V autoproteolytic subunit [Candidatus Cloacimonadota bacterium]
MNSKSIKSDGSIKAIYRFQEVQKLKRPLLGTNVPAGFPSPAQDYIEGLLDLNEHLIRHPSATFFMRADGYSMKNAGIIPGDLLIVDRALEATSNNIIVAIVDGEFTLKRLKIEQGNYFLIPENEEFDPIPIDEDVDFVIWGVVTYVIHPL